VQCDANPRLLAGPPGLVLVVPRQDQPVAQAHYVLVGLVTAVGPQSEVGRGHHFRPLVLERASPQGAQSPRSSVAVASPSAP
jgi:hypothetical protein